MTDAAHSLVRLETGDSLTRGEFHRRYLARPDIRRAELIDGVVHVHSPTRFDQHDEPATTAVGWLGTYAMRLPNVRAGGRASIFLDANSEIQADGFLFYDPPSWPGGSHRTPGGYLEGAPELIVEVGASSARYDLTTKRRAYERAGVQEYIVWRTLDRAVDWFRLRGGAYERLEPDEHGVIASEVFPGLRLSVPALLAGELARVITALDHPERR